MFCVALCVQSQRDDRAGYQPGARLSLLSTGAPPLAVFSQKVAPQVSAYADWQYHSEFSFCDPEMTTHGSLEPISKKSNLKS
jgi:hypothetical protein